MENVEFEFSDVGEEFEAVHLDIVQDSLLIRESKGGDFAVSIDCISETFGDTSSVESCDVINSSHNVSGELFVEFFIFKVHPIFRDSVVKTDG